MSFTFIFSNYTKKSSRLSMKDLQLSIDNIWSNRETLKRNSKDWQHASQIISKTMEALEQGKIRVCQKIDGNWQVNQWIKKAILLTFIFNDNQIIQDGADIYYDKVPLKCANWGEDDFRNAGFRIVPGAKIRKYTYIAPKAVIMPSFVNVGAYIDENTMIDTWATVGSCAQIGKHCHISGGAGIGGVLEPLQANPVIIEDNVFVGARSEIAEGVIVGEGSVISMGVYIGSSTRIYDRETGEIFYGKVPPYSVIVPGTLTGSLGDVQQYAVIIVKKVDDKTRQKVSINEILRGVE
jgi:2,3,4,5-tetrahydropyridine-2-carboxylate N-succinyltransferase